LYNIIQIFFIKTSTLVAVFTKLWKWDYEDCD